MFCGNLLAVDFAFIKVQNLTEHDHCLFFQYIHIHSISFHSISFHFIFNKTIICIFMFVLLIMVIFISPSSSSSSSLIPALTCCTGKSSQPQRAARNRKQATLRSCILLVDECNVQNSSIRKKNESNSSIRS